MKYALPFALFATPVLAHPGAHLHAQDATQLIIGLALLTIVVARVVAVRVHQ